MSGGHGGAGVGTVAAFHVASFFSEGPPHDKGLPVRAQYEHLREAFIHWCDGWHGYSPRRLRTSVLVDGTRGADYVREYSAVAGYLNYPNTGYNAIGFGAFKPFIVLHVLERLKLGDTLLFMDCNVFKHWNLVAFPEVAAQTTRWLIDTHGHEDVAMPRENPATKHVHICSTKALDAAEATCNATWFSSLAQLPSPHSNRLAVRSSAASAALMRLWLRATQLEETYLPSPVRPGGRWHTPEQCSFGLIEYG